jgi:alkylation response protein AidB-like acyl-CoA dehydrogenase
VTQPTQEQIEFREYARRWLEENKPRELPFRLAASPIEITSYDQKAYLQAWQRRCYEARLVGCAYPREYGGWGMPECERIAQQELVRARAPFLLNLVALNMVAPTLFRHGTEEQKRRFLPGCLSADEIWCQGFSEPGAGSDLANIQTFGERCADVWIVNGHKVWTSLGQFAKWMILLTRTSRDHKYRGLTYFICPVEGTAGITVRPLVKMTGEPGFNEVLLENVQIPDDLRIDQVGAGWNVAMTTLLHERGAAEGAGGNTRPTQTTDRLIAHARRTFREGQPASDDPVMRDQIMRLVIRAHGVHQNALRAAVPALCDHPLRLPLQSKLLASELEQDVARLGMELSGMAGQLAALDPCAPDEGHWPAAYMNSYGFTIAAGTSEIQRNILGERVLGLEKSKLPRRRWTLVSVPKKRCCAIRRASCSTSTPPRVLCAKS